MIKTVEEKDLCFNRVVCGGKTVFLLDGIIEF